MEKTLDGNSAMASHPAFYVLHQYQSVHITVPAGPTRKLERTNKMHTAIIYTFVTITSQVEQEQRYSQFFVSPLPPLRPYGLSSLYEISKYKFIK